MCGFLFNLWWLSFLLFFFAGNDSALTFSLPFTLMCPILTILTILTLFKLLSHFFDSRKKYWDIKVHNIFTALVYIAVLMAFPLVFVVKQEVTIANIANYCFEPMSLNLFSSHLAKFFYLCFPSVILYIMYVCTECGFFLIVSLIILNFF